MQVVQSQHMMLTQYGLFTEAPSDKPDIQDLYCLLHTPLPIPLPEEPGASIIASFGLKCLDAESKKALDSQKDAVDPGILEVWWEVLCVIGCWVTTPGVRKLVEQYKRPGGEAGPALTLDEQAMERFTLGTSQDHEHKPWSLKQLKTEALALCGTSTRWKHGPAVQHMALIANNPLLHVRVVTEADVETEMVPRALLGQKNVVAKMDLPAGTIMDFYGGIYASSAALLCSSFLDLNCHKLCCRHYVTYSGIPAIFVMSVTHLK
jgi:hypothetical protein